MERIGADRGTPGAWASDPAVPALVEDHEDQPLPLITRSAEVPGMGGPLKPFSPRLTPEHGGSFLSIKQLEGSRVLPAGITNGNICPFPHHI